MTVAMPDVLVRCVECLRWSPKRCSEGMARRGYGACDRHEPFICYAGDKLRDCADFAKTTPDVISARLAFMEKNQ